MNEAYKNPTNETFLLIKPFLGVASVQEGADRAAGLGPHGSSCSVIINAPSLSNNNLV